MEWTTYIRLVTEDFPIFPPNTNFAVHRLAEWEAFLSVTRAGATILKEFFTRDNTIDYDLEQNMALSLALLVNGELPVPNAEIRESSRQVAIAVVLPALTLPSPADST